MHSAKTYTYYYSAIISRRTTENQYQTTFHCIYTWICIFCFARKKPLINNYDFNKLLIDTLVLWMYSTWWQWTAGKIVQPHMSIRLLKDRNNNQMKYIWYWMKIISTISEGLQINWKRELIEVVNWKLIYMTKIYLYTCTWLYRTESCTVF